MGVLIDSDIAELMHLLLGAFAIGFVSGAILRVFRKFAERSTTR